MSDEIEGLDDLMAEVLEDEQELQLNLVGPQVIDDAAIGYYLSRQHVAELEAVLSEAKAKMLEAERHLHDVIEATGSKSFKHSVGTLTRRVKIVPQVKDKEAFLKAVEETGQMDDFFPQSRRLNLKALNQHVKETYDRPDSMMTGLSAVPLKKITFRRDSTFDPSTLPQTAPTQED